MVSKLRLDMADALNDGQQLVDGVVAEEVAGGVGAPALGDDFELDAPLVPAINLHHGWLADDHEIGLDAFGLDESVGSLPVVPFFHVAKEVGGEAIQQSQLPRQRQAIDHAGRAAFFVACAARVQNAVFYLAREWIPLPFVRVANADGVDVAVVKQDFAALADSADDVAHFVPENLVIAKRFHFCGDTLAAIANLAVHAGDGADLAQEGDDVLALVVHLAPQRLHCRVLNHCLPRVKSLSSMAAL